MQVGEQEGLSSSPALWPSDPQALGKLFSRPKLEAPALYSGDTTTASRGCRGEDRKGRKANRGCEQCFPVWLGQLRAALGSSKVRASGPAPSISGGSGGRALSPLNLCSPVHIRGAPCSVWAFPQRREAEQRPRGDGTAQPQVNLFSDF